MKKVFAYSILAILVLTGCQDKVLEGIMVEQGVLPVQESKPFIAIIENGGIGNETKTTLDNNGHVLWKQGDQVSIFAGSTANECYQVTDESEGKTSASLHKVPGGGGGAGTNIENNVAFYPYSSTATIKNSGSDYVISGIELPATQHYVKGSFDNGAFPMAAITGTTDETNLTFKNVLGGLMLQLKGTATIASIAVTGNNDEILCGAAEVTVSTGSTPAINLTNASAKTVTLDCGAGVTLDAETATSFIIALPPMTMIGGFTVIVTDTEGKEMDIKTTVPQTISRSGLLKMPAVSYVGSDIYAVFSDWVILPSGVDKSGITEVNFYVSTDKTTDTVISCSLDFNNPYVKPVYFELEGTVANFYTKGKVYKITDARWMFAGWSSLRTLDLSMFDTSTCMDFNGMFSRCVSLRDLNLKGFNTSNVSNMEGMFRHCISLESIDLSSFNTSNVQNMYYMFTGCRSLRELDLSNFDTHNVINMGDLFNSCYRLEKLDISGFSSDKLEYAPELFFMCTSLLKLNLGSFDISNLSDHFNTCYKLASRSRNCAILCTPATKVALLSDEAKLQGCVQYIQWLVPGDVLPDLTMNYDPDLYYSTDYSKDKLVKMLNVASEGNGIDVVIMGEAYSDRLIADGTYEADMTAAMDQIFSIEPFKSFKRLFNVYMVNAVSENEVPGEFTIFGYAHDPWFGNGGIDRDDEMINEYISQAVGRSENRKVTTVIVVNDNSGVGVSMMNKEGYYTSDSYDYPALINGIAFCCKSTDSERFRYTICHEFGHAFAALHDEYVTVQGEMETWESDYKKLYQQRFGWWANISFTPDPNLVGWKKFLEEGSGYDDTEVSIIEGALYSQGIWKSVEQSMMNAGGEYSVPAREAIYKKIHKTAYGEEWQYSFTDFVSWDKSVIPSTPHTKSYSPSIKSSIRHPKPIFKIEESISGDGTKRITIIQN